MDTVHGPLSVQYEKLCAVMRTQLDQPSVVAPRAVEDIELCRLLLNCVTLMATWVWQSSTTARREVSKIFED